MAALSVVYSNLGIKVFQPYFFSASFNVVRIPELAETPPPIATCLIPVSLTANLIPSKFQWLYVVLKHRYQLYFL